MATRAGLAQKTHQVNVAAIDAESNFVHQIVVSLLDTIGRSIGRIIEIAGPQTIVDIAAITTHGSIENHRLSRGQASKRLNTIQQRRNNASSQSNRLDSEWRRPREKCAQENVFVALGTGLGPTEAVRLCFKRVCTVGKRQRVGSSTREPRQEESVLGRE